MSSRAKKKRKNIVVLMMTMPPVAILIYEVVTVWAQRVHFVQNTSLNFVSVFGIFALFGSNPALAIGLAFIELFVPDCSMSGVW
ncbi:unnamed protein product [Nippostrongylus brasiliensis]|uniref:G_PROTEIN_RECEP_F1_2 domain-containing protein n=1 Tax=Nippostrongylus brasiliensis TaxID=27835 RepID=A0A0N4XRF9_NIPBR|nr:unnamed protein product [Nippostrongylus brasiliensis]